MRTGILLQRTAPERSAGELFGQQFFFHLYTGWFEMTVGVLTTSHTQYTSDSSICFFVFNRTTLQVFVTHLTGALYVNPLWFYKHQHDNRVRSELFVACQRWWFQWRFRFVPSFPGYVMYGKKTWSFVLLNKKIHILLSQMYGIVYNKLLKPRQSFPITLYLFLLTSADTNWSQCCSVCL